MQINKRYYTVNSSIIYTPDNLEAFWQKCKYSILQQKHLIIIGDPAGLEKELTNEDGTKFKKLISMIKQIMVVVDADNLQKSYKGPTRLNQIMMKNIRGC